MDLNPKALVGRVKLGGFPRDSQDIIHIFQGGSHQHGASIPGKVSDVDVFGVYIEDPNEILGVNKEEHFTGGTQDQYERNRPGDEDYKMYTLRRWAGLACGGNPTILGFLYTPCEMPTVWHQYIQTNRSVFQAKSHASAFIGYAQGQIKRLSGESGKGKHGQRPELEQAYGYDTKAAMHLMRLLFEAEEYLLRGHITYPRPEKDLLLSIRQGEWTWQKLFKEHAEQEKKVNAAYDRSHLPEKVDRSAVSELIAWCYMTHWKRKGKLEEYLGIKSTEDTLSIQM